MISRRPMKAMKSGYSPGLTNAIANNGRATTDFNGTKGAKSYARIAMLYSCRLLLAKLATQEDTHSLVISRKQPLSLTGSYRQPHQSEG
jgi:hypothetical protein